MTFLSRLLRYLIFLCFLLPTFSAWGQIKPSVAYEDLFEAVQLAEIFPDSKTFPDCIPKRSIQEILVAYRQEKDQANFNLKNFVNKEFTPPENPNSDFKSDPNRTIKEHLTQLWPILTRQPNQDQQETSLIPLPKPYVVPGGRFREIYYWDSYFTMLGLEVSKENKLIENMVDNFAHIIDKVGHIPNGNRSYYLSRSQPPFFSQMVSLLAKLEGNSYLSKYLPQLEKEYDFWMDGQNKLSAQQKSYRRIVYLGEGEFLNRYWDDNPTPRPESFKEDYHLAQEDESRSAEEVYRNIRAACESGWDFSSRWFRDGQNLNTIHTTEIIPVDLNALLYYLETLLSKAYELQNEEEKSQRFAKLAERRATLIRKYCWDGKFYTDYDFITQKAKSSYSLAGLFPLYFDIASEKEAKQVKKIVEKKFLKPGGLVSTLNNTGQQWDAPNGWAPLQWIAIKGLRNYNYQDLANMIQERWIKLNTTVYQNTGKMVEKYNVMDTSLEGGGGEYPVQDGFGWSNGVLLRLLSDKEKK